MQYIHNLLQLKNIIRYSFIKIKNIRNTCLHIRFTPNKSNQYWIAHTEQKVCAIIQTSVFCVGIHPTKTIQRFPPT